MVGVARRARRLARIVLIAGGLSIIALMILEIVYFMAPSLVGAGLRRELSLTLYASSSATGTASLEAVASELAKALNAGSHRVIVLGSNSNRSLAAAVLYSHGEPILVIIAPLQTMRLIASDSQLSSRLLSAALGLPSNETLVFIPGVALEKMARNKTAVEQLVARFVAGS